MSDPKHLIRTGKLDWETARHARHPYNEKSEMRGFALADMVGQKRTPVHLLRVPPGKETFAPHAHAVEEEWVFVLEGAGTATLDSVDYAIGPGDYLGFPTDGVIHQIRNTGAVDLVYLTGGERGAVEVATMPSLGKIAVFQNNAVTFFDADSANAERITMAEWARRAALKSTQG